VLTRHPAVSEAVSFAIPDELYGQNVGVAVVLKSGQAANAQELKDWVGNKLATFKVPKSVCFSPLFYSCAYC
jgi:acyl-coenzyme A synthetase/AMP-(fatty) acid ligase